MRFTSDQLISETNWAEHRGFGGEKAVGLGGKLRALLTATSPEAASRAFQALDGEVFCQLTIPEAAFPATAVLVAAATEARTIEVHRQVLELLFHVSSATPETNDERGRTLRGRCDQLVIDKIDAIVARAAATAVVALRECAWDIVKALLERHPREERLITALNHPGLGPPSVWEDLY